MASSWRSRPRDLRPLPRALRRRARPRARGDDDARAKEGLAIHLFAPAFAGAAVQRVPVEWDGDFADAVEEAWLASHPRPRVLLCSYSLTKGFSLAGRWTAFLLGRADVVAALARLKSYLDYGSFQPLQIAAAVALRDAREQPAVAAAAYQGGRNALCDGLARIGWRVPRPPATMFVWAPIPTEEPAQEFSLRLLR